MNLITASIIFFLFIAPSAAWSTEMSKQAAQAYIEKFRNDRRSFSGTPQGLVIDGKIDPDGFEVLRQGLLNENQDTRENIITLLIKMNDQVLGQHGPLSVDLIIQTLATEAIAKDDTASEEATQELLRQCSKETLEKYNDNYLAAVNRDPSIYMMLLIAKAKTMAARPRIEALLQNAPEWKGNTQARIAAAALGNTKIEDEFIDQAKRAETGDDLRHALANLKYIGTRRSLQTIASFLRSPLVHGWSQTSLRLVAMDALRFTYRDERVLSSFMLSSQEDYERVEKFVADVLDVHFEGPLPPFYRDTPVPIPLPGQRIQLPKAAP